MWYVLVAGRVLTSQIKEVVVLQAVDGLELAAHVVLLGRVEQVSDGRVLVISAKDLLGLEGSFSFVSFCCFVLMRASITQELGICLEGTLELTCLACRRPLP